MQSLMTAELPARGVICSFLGWKSVGGWVEKSGTGIAWDNCTLPRCINK